VAVLDQWSAIAQKSGICVLHCGKKHTWEILGAFRPSAPKLYMIGYEAAKARPSLLLSKTWHRVICDEAHRLGSGKSCFQLIKKLDCKHHWLLTATPIINSIKDIKNLLDLVGVPDVAALSSSIEAMRPVLGSVVLARTMDQLRASTPDAPPKPEIQTITLPFDTEEEGDFYRGMTGNIVRRWKALEADSGPSGSPLLKLQLFMRLRQLSLHPQIYIQARREAMGALYSRPNWGTESTKFNAIKRMMEAEPGHKWIIFCHFHPEMSLLQDMLAKIPSVRSISMYSGALTYEQRKSVIDASYLPLTSDKESDVLLIQLQSGGVGLNLQHFDRILFTGPWWTSALMEQAIGRAVRIGQKNVVQVYHLSLVEESALNIDAIIMEKATEKGEMCRSVLGYACNAMA
jgi:SNF2 family DNA or RNA helicase